ncbi:sensor histidine kinase [Nocardioides massiliensis]|uniref:Signal transduction histidine kinase n=1 Tax=Nocardioides massiliensis TaxID=1325935 RepID=A0ABT9NJP7_9ACTN|nr:histidine kinase [Nocardioides massiliensis]MDP9820623.1 signal transduction histidine kinase [Nocardioides massiliensis]
MEERLEVSRTDAVLDAIAALAVDADVDRVLSRFAGVVVDLVGGSSGALTVGAHLDAPARTYAAPADPASTTARTLTIPIFIGAREAGALQVGCAGDRTFSAEDRRIITTFAQAAGMAISVGREIARSERRHRWLAASAVLATLLHDLHSAEEAMTALAAHVRAAAAAAVVAVVVLDEGPSEPGGPVGPAGPVTLRPRIVGHDGLSEEDVAALARVLTPALVEAGREGRVRAVDAPDGSVVLLAPLRAEVARDGLLMVGYPTPRRDLDPEEAGMLAAFADHVSLVLDRVQALLDHQELLLLGDRERIARDLHDHVVQRIFAVGLQLERARRAGDLDEVRDRLTGAMEDLDGTISEIRRTIFHLERPHSRSVRGAVAAVVREYAEVLQSVPELRFDGPVDAAVGQELTEHLVAVVRESLSNVARHAGARACRVEVAVDAERLRLTVTDDGVGTSGRRRGTGLRNAERRARALGGTFEVTTPDDGGTRLQWEVPSAFSRVD